MYKYNTPDKANPNTHFRVSTAILNTKDISRRWCKLNFGLFEVRLNHAISLNFWRREETIF